jgi:hypothetical protein
MVTALPGLAQSIAQRDGHGEGWREHGAGDVPDVLVAVRDPAAGCRHGVSADRQADQLACDPAVAAIPDADDDFLTWIAAFQVADGARLDARLERDRVFRHVDKERRIAGLHAQHLGDTGRERHAARVQERLGESRAPLGDREEQDPGQPEPVRSGHDDQFPMELRARVLERAVVREIRRQHAAGDTGCLRTVDARAAPCITHVAQLNIFAEDQPVEIPEEQVLDLAVHVEQCHVAQLEHLHVGDHPALRGQERGVTPGSRGEQGDVVRKERVKKRLAVRAAHDNPAARAPVADARTLPDGCAFVQLAHRSCPGRGGLNAGWTAAPGP